MGIAIKQCPFELAEATPEAIREWIDQMQDSGLTGLTINSKCSLLSGLVAKCMKSGLLRGLAMNPFDLRTTALARQTTSTQQLNGITGICLYYCQSFSIGSSSLS